MSDSPLPIAVFLSGSGRSLANLIKHRDQHGLPIDLRLVISSNTQAGGVDIARAANIEVVSVHKSGHPDPYEYSKMMFGPCRDRSVQLVVMAGFLKHVLIPSDFQGRVINIHPSLLPAFGGSGMYGLKVHQAAIDRGVQFSGCTVHYVDNEYDQGPILLQRTCGVAADDTAESLAARVFAEECEALPEAIRRFARQIKGVRPL